MSKDFKSIFEGNIYVDKEYGFLNNIKEKFSKAIDSNKKTTKNLATSLISGMDSRSKGKSDMQIKREFLLNKKNKGLNKKDYFASKAGAKMVDFTKKTKPILDKKLGRFSPLKDLEL